MNHLRTTIQCNILVQSSGMFLDSSLTNSYKMPPAPILYRQNYNGLDNQIFRLNLTNESAKQIICKKNDKVLDVSQTGDQASIPVNGTIYEQNLTNEDNQKFIVFPIDTADSSQLSDCVIGVVYDGRVWDISQTGESKIPEKGIAYAHENIPGSNNQLFTLVDGQAIKFPAIPKIAKSPYPTLKSRQKPSQTTTKPVVTSYSLIPYFTVDDPEFSDKWKIQNSPYYILERWSCYTLDEKFWINNVTDGEQSAGKFTITTGFSETQSTSFSKTVGLSITGEIGTGETSPVQKKLSITNYGHFLPTLPSVQFNF